MREFLYNLYVGTVAIVLGCLIGLIVMIPMFLAAHYNNASFLLVYGIFAPLIITEVGKSVRGK